MEALEQRITEKKEQQAFIAGVIAEKQRQCQQAKEQHEERIKALARQSRRQRIRQQVGRDSALEGGLLETSGSPTQATQDAAFPQGCCAPTALNIKALDEVLGAAERQHLLGADGHRTEAGGAGLAAVQQVLD